uniref:Low density lipoprotein receptor adapter protein 1-B-like n=1 Tax=Hirondellea gigas TaxID=1518452 RepID=A0A2P2HZD2_9CRUS
MSCAVGMRNQLQNTSSQTSSLTSQVVLKTADVRCNSSDDISKKMSKMSTADDSRNGADGKTQDSTDNQQKTTIQQDPVTISFPQMFEVKYLGRRDAGGLWGIKHTRRPVDEMVASAKELKPGETLPFLNLVVSEKGVNISEMPKNINKDFEGGFYPIEVISYGVQDLVYTRVFAMIVVQEDASSITTTHPFHCHAFVCDSRQSARHLTFALAQAFQLFSKQVKGKAKKPKKFAIDLRPAEEKEADLRDMDSEA